MRGEELFLLEGRLDAFLWANSSAELMARLKDLAQKKGGDSAKVAAFRQMHNAFSASGGLADYDTMHFAARLDGRVVWGVLEDADNLQSGDLIRAVVTQQGDLLYVHSIHRSSDNLLLLPSAGLCGNGAFFNRCMTVAWNITKMQWWFFGVLFFLFLLIDDRPQDGRYLILVLFVLLGPPLIMFPMEYWSYRTLGPEMGYAESIFKAYGIPHADEFDALKGMDNFSGPAGMFFAPNLAKAMHEHGKKFHIAV